MTKRRKNHSSNSKEVMQPSNSLKDAAERRNNAAHRRQIRKMIIDNKKKRRILKENLQTYSLLYLKNIVVDANPLTSVPATPAAQRRHLRRMIINNKKHERMLQHRLQTSSSVSLQNNSPILTQQTVLPSTVVLNEPAHRRLLRKNIINVKNKKGILQSNAQLPSLTETVPDVNSAAHRRRLRKMILDNKKRKRLSPHNVNQTDTTNDQQVIKGVSPDYLDHGDQIITCQLCQAKLWKKEASKKRETMDKQTFSMCCGYGKVVLPVLKDASPEYQSLFKGLDSKSKFFLNSIRRYNSMFSFTSMGGKVDENLNKGRAPSIYRLSGQNCHSIGSLLPKDGTTPKFSQLYIYDTENEICNRQKIFRDTKNKATETDKQLDVELIQNIKIMLDSENELVKTYRMVRDHFHQNPEVSLKLRIIYNRERDGRTYNLPTSSEVAALIVGDITEAAKNRDIIVESHSEGLQRISELHPSYLALQYPILFPYGDDGYRIDIPHRDGIITTKKIPPTCTMREFFAYRIQDRCEGFSLILNARKLFQQFLVDAYTMIESERLLYILSKQKHLRCDSYENLYNLSRNGDSDLSQTGKRIVLPSSFTGGARYMQQNYLDAMSLCKWYGYPDFFITVTCNPKWPEIKRFLQDKTIQPQDRPDILSRIFKLKLNAIIKDLKVNQYFGSINAVVYTVEFQKRGLPHAHICLFLKASDKVITPAQIDCFISAEIPCKVKEPELYDLVAEFMIHGPCGTANLKSPCMVDDKCSKDFPKKIQPETAVDENGFPVYKRRDNGLTVTKSGVELDNRYVVPYNKRLLKRYQAHINVEWCNQGASIKYLFKYINKGPDRASLAFTTDETEGQQLQQRNEIKEYYDCRYVSACEASWRIFSFDVHYRYPSVMRLPFHLPNQQKIVFGANEDIDNVLSKRSVASSIFLEWMVMNQKSSLARTLTYGEFPTKFTWKIKKRCWKERKSFFSTIGRVYSVPPSLGEPYFLRILLNIVKGPKSFEEIRTVNGKMYETFRDACYARGLLDDDSEYVEAIIEASFWALPSYLRYLFGTLLTSDSLSRPDYVWEQTWKLLAEDILHERQKRFPGRVIPEDVIQNLTLMEIEKFLRRNNSTLKRYNTMPYPNTTALSDIDNRLINDELSFDQEVVLNEFNRLKQSLTSEQQNIFEQIINAVQNQTGGVFFVYGFGGTGKTFLWKTLASSIRSKGEIVLNVASSGIASLLMSRGRTAHSRFHIPININEDTICNITPNSDEANLLKKTKLIIWDEAPMVHRHAIEALDRTMKDVLSTDTNSTSNLPFGGKVVVFGGDFRQILPVVQNGSRQDITTDIQKTEEFAKWILEVGEGTVGDPNDGETNIKIPADILISDTSDPIQSLINFVYPSLIEQHRNHSYFSERAILTPKNEIVHDINDRLIALFPGKQKEYLSSDSICPSEALNPFQELLYSPDVLNNLQISGLPNHKLVLKVGLPVMLLRNLDQQQGLCNGTRLRLTKLGQRVLEGEIISGGNVGTKVFIPRINMIPSDNKIPFKFKRRQFPITVCFAMTINKSQGQSLSRVGLYLKEPVFTHGQLYVALSRVTSKDGLKLLILNKDGEVQSETKNVVYKEVFSQLS